MNGINTRPQALAWLADRIAAIERPHAIRVAIDGVDGAGKTKLADELVAPLEARSARTRAVKTRAVKTRAVKTRAVKTPLGRPVIRASLDGFHNPRAIRYRLGADSPQGYYRDSFNYAAVLTSLLEPLGPGGSGVYRTAVFDHIIDSPVDMPRLQAPSGAILLFDGIFLLRPELRAHWDFTLFVDLSFETAVIRAIDRDLAHAKRSKLIRRYQRRYVPGQEIYLRRCRPRELADVVFNNEELERPTLFERQLGE